MSQTPAGWHLQPDGRERYWDGTQWTEQYRPAPAGAGIPPHQPPAPPGKSHTLRNVLLVLVGLLVLGIGGCAVLAGAFVSSVDDAIEESTSRESQSGGRNRGGADDGPDGSGLSGSRAQAVTAAEQYLDLGTGFSRAGLLDQLTSKMGNGFSQADAEFAIRYLDPDWNEQAVMSAESYLDIGTGFSEAGLIDQLTAKVGSQFTMAEAQHAIDELDPDWNEQAVLAAENYLDLGMGMSRSGLIQQLTAAAGSQFTQAQAEYAADEVGL